jgi:hypothetical protein
MKWKYLFNFNAVYKISLIFLYSKNFLPHIFNVTKYTIFRNSYRTKNTSFIFNKNFNHERTDEI